MKRLVIVNKKRFMLTTTVLLIFLLYIISSIYAVINKVEGYQEKKVVEVYVDEGDTVWNLAKRYISNDKDIREAIYEISRLNSLESFNIYPGQMIKIPIE